MTGGESPAHFRLKQLALSWAQVQGFEIAATEVRLPRSHYRLDAAALSRRPERRTAIFECKQSRPDLLKDARAEVEAKIRVTELSARLQALEGMLGTHRPDLRCGESLFPEFDAWNFTGLEHATHRRVIAELATWQERLLHGTKFAKLFRWACADFLYLVSEDGIFAEAEIPAGWGLLVRRDEELFLARRPTATQVTEESRTALLEAIAVAATRAVQRQAGVTPIKPVWAQSTDARQRSQSQIAAGTR
jgi:hypothetical protein